MKGTGYGLLEKRGFFRIKRKEKTFPTPLYSDYGVLRCSRQQYFSKTCFGSSKNCLSTIIFLRLNLTRKKARKNKLILNPNWIEWLMGYPYNFSSLDPVLINDFQAWQKKIKDKTIWKENLDIPQIKIEEKNDRNRNSSMGNGQVSLCVFTVWKKLTGGKIENRK